MKLELTNDKPVSRIRDAIQPPHLVHGPNKKKWKLGPKKLLFLRVSKAEPNSYDSKRA